ncbi:unnamed protein product [Spirodela intermedia]|uniref:Glutaredoxin domain-containing protein n=2 Tax=Spirodela intermedia TaxID=51605 RepID=A0A7I8L1Q9_SPIIN|nr:unnamed protein product [Spirodela intermedia]CAA6667122.1 unnamed protein product [Spirodela intermedia]CAA7403941.1 unnamed protein product [Spirodela intermedia]
MPGREKAAVLYITSLGGVRKTFEDCNSMRLLLESLGMRFYERDVSRHLAYREELRRALGGPARPRRRRLGAAAAAPRGTAHLRQRRRRPCGGCGGFRFSVCPRCGGGGGRRWRCRRGGRCTGCNGNGLVVCGLCSWPCE